MRTLLTTLAFVAFCAALFTRAAAREEPEQREAVYALDGETADDARARQLEPCTSSEFGFCHPFPTE
jgi:hypothetical protein